MSPAASRCCRRCRPRSARRRRSASRCSPARPRTAGSTRCCATPGTATLAPLYNFMDDLPALRGRAAADPAAQHVRRTSGSLSSIDLGRGCPYQCSFCTIINVQGRKSRFRSPDDLERIIRENYRAGHQAVLHHRRQFRAQPPLGAAVRPHDRAARGEGLNIGFTIQVDTLCHRIPNFIEKAAAPACGACSSGWRTSTRTICSRAKKRQNKITEYRDDAAAMARARRHHLCRLHHRLSRATPRSRSCATSRSSSANCRSTSSNSSS